MVNRYNAVVLLSGGMDSTTALAVALSGHNGYGNNPNASWGSGEVLGLSFNYGQRHRMQELDAAQKVAHHYNIDQEEVVLQDLGRLLGGSSLTDVKIPVPDGHYAAETMKVTVVPNRNAIMLSIAFGIARAAGATQVYAGMHAGDHAVYPDCRPAFMTAFDAAMALANDDLEQGDKPKLITPFIHANKTDIVTTGHLLHVPFELTYSCYKGQRYHCGLCGTCTERIEAFQLAGVTDPTRYETDTVKV